jgi:hypothetical protein
MEKVCSLCQERLDISNFHKRTYKSGKVGTQPKCKKCSTINRRQYYKPHEAARRRHSLTEEEYAELMGVSECQICSSPMPRKCIDHDHETNEVRGVLCHSCNRGIGLLGDNIATLQNAINYLQKHQ